MFQWISFVGGQCGVVVLLVARLCALVRACLHMCAPVASTSSCCVLVREGALGACGHVRQCCVFMYEFALGVVCRGNVGMAEWWPGITNSFGMFADGGYHRAGKGTRKAGCFIEQWRLWCYDLVDLQFGLIGYCSCFHCHEV